MNEAAVEALLEPRLERFIGVIYRPETERWSHYAEAVLPNQFDAWVWFDETEAVTPLPGAGAAERRGRDLPVRAVDLPIATGRGTRRSRWRGNRAGFCQLPLHHPSDGPASSAAAWGR